MKEQERGFSVYRFRHQMQSRGVAHSALWRHEPWDPIGQAYSQNRTPVFHRLKEGGWELLRPREGGLALRPPLALSSARAWRKPGAAEPARRPNEPSSRPDEPFGAHPPLFESQLLAFECRGLTLRGEDGLDAGYLRSGGAAARPRS